LHECALSRLRALRHRCGDAAPNFATAFRPGATTACHMTNRALEELWYGVSRLTVPIPPVREFQARYESAVPEVPADAVAELVSRKSPWLEMRRLIDRAAPHGFLIYFRNDVHPVMTLAGDNSDCISYLMGNHIIAERMFKYDPRVMLYAPLRTAIWEDKDGHGWFTTDQPSTLFASFTVPEIAEVGVDLDRKLAALLAYLDVPVPDALRT
jgi:uncharacterized protein (DUF302 family)